MAHTLTLCRLLWAAFQAISPANSGPGLAPTGSRNHKVIGIELAPHAQLVDHYSCTQATQYQFVVRETFYPPNTLAGRQIDF